MVTRLLAFILCWNSVIGLPNPLYPDFPGPYCSRLRRCCSSRKDECSLPISTTKCYCDEFCTHARDCCPDYESFCLNQILETPPGNFTQQTKNTMCVHNGVTFGRNDPPVKDFCNVW